MLFYGKIYFPVVWNDVVAPLQTTGEKLATFLKICFL